MKCLKALELKKCSQNVSRMKFSSQSKREYTQDRNLPTTRTAASAPALVELLFFQWKSCSSRKKENQDGQRKDGN